MLTPVVLSARLTPVDDMVLESDIPKPSTLAVMIEPPTTPYIAEIEMSFGVSSKDAGSMTKSWPLGVPTSK